MLGLNLGVFRCPVCGGSIARWVIRAEFTCHHCHWALASNLASIARRALLIAVIVEVLLFLAVWLTTGSLLSATAIYLYVAVFLGALAWFLVMDLGLTLKPLRPPSQ
jgi:uncharacterized protein (DUF983 family)